jgi:hypothetical protein
MSSNYSGQQLESIEPKYHKKSSLHLLGKMFVATQHQATESSFCQRHRLWIL